MVFPGEAGQVPPGQAWWNGQARAPIVGSNRSSTPRKPSSARGILRWFDSTIAAGLIEGIKSLVQSAMFRYGSDGHSPALSGNTLLPVRDGRWA
jgi:hypothetical protein